VEFKALAIIGYSSRMELNWWGQWDEEILVKLFKVSAI
jgi:hypothetical protein